VVRVLAVGAARIELERLEQRPATEAAAEDFGRTLAATHAAGGGWFGCPPPGWDGDGYIGTAPLPLLSRPDRAPADWAGFYAGQRLAPYLRQARDLGHLDAAQARVLDSATERIAAGGPALCGPPEPPARLHGDLWSGNVLWTARGATLIDPAAHGGHRETDLAMLALFGLPMLARVLDAYQEAAPLADGWQRRSRLHQLHPLLVHTVLFGGGYAGQAVAAARACP
jgi:fructosamine-3-kinase